MVVPFQYSREPSTGPLALFSALAGSMDAIKIGARYKRGTSELAKYDRGVNNIGTEHVRAVRNRSRRLHIIRST